jgi:hypothetical protein
MKGCPATQEPPSEANIDEASRWKVPAVNHNHVRTGRLGHWVFLDRHSMARLTDGNGQSSPQGSQGRASRRPTKSAGVKKSFCANRKNGCNVYRSKPNHNHLLNVSSLAFKVRLKRRKKPEKFFFIFEI